jgi:hypothetical protein
MHVPLLQLLQPLLYTTHHTTIKRINLTFSAVLLGKVRVSNASTGLEAL